AATVVHSHTKLEDCEACIVRLREVASLYNGDFLAGFSLDSDLFEAWITTWREKLHIQALDILDHLATYHEQRGDYAEVIRYAQRQIDLEPWRESAHRQWMRGLACSGQRGMALAQYEACQRILKAELNAEPEAVTTHLFQQIRDGHLSLLMPTVPVTLAPRPPIFLDTDIAIESPTFVARECELTRMDAALQAALKGQGHVLLIAGEAGQGKTALMQAFTARALAKVPDIVIANGRCNAYTGVGDPYLPFREILEMLTGDVEAQYAAGIISKDHARRLWNTLPLTGQALVTDGADLIGTFVPGLPLLQRAVACTETDMDWLDRLRACVETYSHNASTLRQDDLFEQVTAVLRIVARQVPLLFIIDDMQWADVGSISLLFHLGRRLAGSRILVIGAYRPEEITCGRASEQHPLEPVIYEFQRVWGDIVVDLGRTEAEPFVRALLDSEAHILSAAFCARLTRQTEGHPLFTLELLRGMQERGDLIQNANGQWMEGPALDWEILPARVEAAIAERIHRLPASLQELLRIASVEGEVFTAEAIAQAQRTDPRDFVTHLSDTLRRRHHLVRAESIQSVNDQRLSRYRFRHILFQRYLYNTLDHVERAHLHAQVGTALETLHGDQAAEIALQLALHFERAGMMSEAAEYYRQAGERAIRMSANVEAVAHLNKSIALLTMLPHSRERDERELAIQLAIAMPLTYLKSWSTPEVIRVGDRALELSQSLNNTQQLLKSMMVRQSAHTTLAESHAALAVAKQRYNLIQRLEDPVQMTYGHAGLAITYMFVGQLTDSVQHLKQTMALYDINVYRPLIASAGWDPAVMALSVGLYSLWYLGYPDQALQKSQQGLSIAQELEHPFALEFMLGFKVRLHRWRHEVADVQPIIEAELKLWHEHKIELAKAGAMMEKAWTLSEQGHPDEAIPMFEKGLSVWHKIGMCNHQTEWLGVLAEMYAKAGRPEQGLDLLEEALAFMRQSNERYHEAELYRIRGLLRLQQNKDKTEEAEADFHKAIAAARRMEARMCELRATMCLARLWRQKGKRKQAHQALAEIYGWFTEGFDTLDLKEAKSLLDELTV
ncbi:MAG: BTAD domain-containing putative transcriptional regulator, partial [Anaerolineae bacterium]